LQERFDATYVDTSTEFNNKGFGSLEEEAAFESDLKVVVADLEWKCPEGYSIEVSPDLLEG
jgi:hypothetical protein